MSKVLSVMRQAVSPRKMGEVDGQIVNIGGLEITKQSGLPTYAAEVALFLLSRGGTFVWDIADEKLGTAYYRNICQVVAALIFGPSDQKDGRAMIEASQEYESSIRSGIDSYARHLSRNYGLELYRYIPPGRNRIVCITVHPDHVVDEETGATAGRATQARVLRELNGQMKRSYRLLAALNGGDREKVTELLARELQQVEKLPLPLPRLQTSLEYIDDDI